MPRVVGGIKMHTTLTVGKADGVERDMYGGAVNVSLSWGAESVALDLDSDGVEQLIAALSEAISESIVDYEDVRARRRDVDALTRKDGDR